jgi:hypothetical protein
VAQLFPLGSIVPTYASIHGHKVRVAGSQSRGWRVADAVDTASSKEALFDISIADDGQAGFLLIYESQDREYYADDWHETLDAAFASAEDLFGLKKDEWIAA